MCMGASGDNNWKAYVYGLGVIENGRGVREEFASKKGNSVKVTFFVDSTAMV